MNKLLKARKLHGLTQQEAADIIGVSLRTYQRYETGDNYGSKRIDNMVTIINNAFHIDEEHGLLTIESISETIKPILESHSVEVCYLFGSYAKGSAKEDSDVDLLVDINPRGIDFFTLVEELRVVLQKKVDLITVNQLTSSSDLLTEILKFGKKIYGRQQ